MEPVLWASSVIIFWSVQVCQNGRGIQVHILDLTGVGIQKIARGLRRLERKDLSP
jgi:hypothetical protein